MKSVFWVLAKLSGGGLPKDLLSVPVPRFSSQAHGTIDQARTGSSQNTAPGNSTGFPLLLTAKEV